jgi:hypothetical protein
MGTRQSDAARGARVAGDDYIRSVAGASDPADQIAATKALLDAGTISQAEFDQLKTKALP